MTQAQREGRITVNFYENQLRVVVIRFHCRSSSASFNYYFHLEFMNCSHNCSSRSNSRGFPLSLSSYFPPESCATGTSSPDVNLFCSSALIFNCGPVSSRTVLIPGLFLVTLLLAVPCTRCLRAIIHQRCATIVQLCGLIFFFPQRKWVSLLQGIILLLFLIHF